MPSAAWWSHYTVPEGFSKRLGKAVEFTVSRRGPPSWLPGLPFWLPAEPGRKGFSTSDRGRVSVELRLCAAKREGSETCL